MRMLGNIVSTIFGSRNPILQMLYLTLVCGIFMIMINYAWPLIEDFYK